MVALTVLQSNANIARLPSGLVALFIGATSSGIGESTLQHLAQHAPAPRIYSVARPQSVAAHETLLASLRKSNPTATITLITADISLVSKIDKIVTAVTQKETKLHIFVTAGGRMAFEGREDTREGLEPSMSTRYYSPLRAVQQLLPFLNAAPSPRILAVLAGGCEAQMNEADLDLRDPANWSYWNAAVHAATMCTLALERLARGNPRLSVVHWDPGPVATPGLAKWDKYGLKPPNQRSQDEGGKRGVFLATSDRYAVQGHGGLVPVPEGLGGVNKWGGDFFG
jgi:NAD(P)-dependent dehydrogenase (short-subunit alcohol dehydrogenase family)